MEEETLLEELEEYHRVVSYPSDIRRVEADIKRVKEQIKSLEKDLETLNKQAN